MRFWDASAVIPLCMAGPSTPRMRDLLEKDEASAVWLGTIVECESALARERREGGLETVDLDRARQILARLADAWTEVAASAEVREQAIRLLGLHPVRAADALQQAAAIAWADQRPLGLPFVCRDTRLREAARAEGFAILPR